MGTILPVQKPSSSSVEFGAGALVGAVACFVLHGIIGSADGAYYHLNKYKPHTHKESFVGHQLHTMRVFMGTALNPIVLFGNIELVFRAP